MPGLLLDDRGEPKKKKKKRTQPQRTQREREKKKTCAAEGKKKQRVLRRRRRPATRESDPFSGAGRKTAENSVRARLLECSDEQGRRRVLARHPEKNKIQKTMERMSRKAMIRQTKCERTQASPDGKDWKRRKNACAALRSTRVYGQSRLSLEKTRQGTIGLYCRAAFPSIRDLALKENAQPPGKVRDDRRTWPREGLPLGSKTEARTPPKTRRWNGKGREEKERRWTTRGRRKARETRRVKRNRRGSKYLSIHQRREGWRKKQRAQQTRTEKTNQDTAQD